MTGGRTSSLDLIMHGGQRMKELINAIILALNKVEVKGEDNLDHLLGAILALKQIVSQLDEKVEEVDESSEDDEEEIVEENNNEIIEE